ncbi:SHOCT domain-containing protein [Sphingomonas sp. LT1P40]|uniref:SHOCT domain-containing protein n=1 Tax=Alteristakelama amylovorans TaxID=3096166 RepID=UPI002FCB412B
MGYRVLRLHTSHDELAFKTFEAKELFDQVYERLEQIRHGDPKPSSASPAADSIPDQLRKLGELRDIGVLTDAEFQAKKTELLARL